MAAGRIDSIQRQYFSPVDAVKLYTDINTRTAEEARHINGANNPFANTRSELGLWQQPTAGYVGQVNGQPPTEYTTKNGYTEEVKRTFVMFA